MILVGIVLGFVPQPYLVLPLFCWWDSYKPRRSRAVPLSYLKPHTCACRRDVNACLRFAHACYLFSLYMRRKEINSRTVGQRFYFRGS